ncbi:MAG: hypothetical protein LIO92_00860 [Clostridiales bacterium]|nr:hypothetical protein [Clostridiales bacterium]
MEGYPLGSYRGFQMELSFDSFSKEFNIALKGSMTHRVPIGSDARGNLIRLDNALNHISAKMEQAQENWRRLNSSRKQRGRRSGNHSRRRKNWLRNPHGWQNWMLPSIWRTVLLLNGKLQKQDRNRKTGRSETAVAESAVLSWQI